jgi:DNA-binding NarL/FixJ family response regulator
VVEPTRVLVADDHPVVRAGLVSILRADPNIRVVGEAKDGLEAISKSLELKPDVILMDVFMPGGTGLDVMVAVKDKLPGTKVLILTVSDQEDNVFQALRLGAQGYLLKSASINDVVDGVKRVAAGETLLSPGIVSRLVAEFRSNSNEPKLSAREIEVLKLLSEGLTNTEIGRRLFIGESTVRTYLRRLLDKLHLKNRVEIATYAAQHHTTNGFH